MRCYTHLITAALLVSACTSDPGKSCEVSSDCPQGAYCSETLKACVETADAGPMDAGPGGCTQVEQNCADGVDDDCNGQIDCADSACGGKACRDDGDPCTVDTCLAGECKHVYPAHSSTEWSNWPALPEERKDSDFVLVGGVGGTVAVDTRTCLMWRRNEEQGTFQWANARTACGGIVGGYNDWRLPTRIELLSLVDLKKTTAPTINMSVFSSSEARFWTTTSDAWDSGRAWYVCLVHGDGDTDPVLQPNRVRCVR